MRWRAVPALIAVVATLLVHHSDAAAAPGELGRVAIIVMENKDYDTIIGNEAEAPFINKLARRNALATNYYGITFPSLPNYMALTSGETHFTTNCFNCSVNVENIVDQMEAAGISWRAYLQSVPSKCYSGPNTPRYVKHHNPFAYYENIANDPSRCNQLVGLDRLYKDIERNRLPQFIWITPNNCKNMHDCSIRTGDRFLEKIVPKVLKRLGKRGVLFVTYDEGQTVAGCCTHANGGHIPTILAGGGVKEGNYDGELNHYSLLRAIEDGWGLPRLGKAAAPETPSMDAMFDF